MTTFKPNDSVHITTFDDGDQPFSNYPNDWIIIGPVTFRDRTLPGKLKIRHRTFDATLNILAWELTLANNQQPDDNVDIVWFSDDVAIPPSSVAPTVSDITHTQTPRVVPHTGGAAGANCQPPGQTEHRIIPDSDNNSDSSHMVQHVDSRVQYAEAEAEADAWTQYATRVQYEATNAEHNAHAWAQHAAQVTVGTDIATHVQGVVATTKANASFWAQHAEEVNTIAWAHHELLRDQQMRDHMQTKQHQVTGC